jgi:acylphosphatase
MNRQIICRRYFVSGQVQGVFYRASAQRLAEDLRICGWVRNCRDGRVEVYACGTPVQHETLKNWLEIGPSHAKVSNIEVRDAEFEPCSQFDIRPTPE